MIEAWVPTAVSGGALALVWWNLRNGKSELKKEISKCVKETEHAILCRANTAEFKLHVSDELIKQKGQIVA